MWALTVPRLHKSVPVIVGVLSLAAWLSIGLIRFSPPVFAHPESAGNPVPLCSGWTQTPDQILEFVLANTTDVYYDDLITKARQGWPFVMYAETGSSKSVVLAVSTSPTEATPFPVLYHIGGTSPNRVFGLMPNQARDGIRISNGTLGDITTYTNINFGGSSTNATAMLTYTNSATDSICIMAANDSVIPVTSGGAHTYIAQITSIPNITQDIDLCNNISGFQLVIPDGMIDDGSGACVVAPSAPSTGLQHKHIQVMAAGITSVLVFLLIREFRWKGTA